MKFICDQKTLHEAITSVSRFVSSRPTHPVLGNIKIVAEGTTVTLTGFDLAMGVELSIFASIQQDGEITLPSKLLSEIVGRLPSGDLAIVVDDDMATITSESGRYNIRGLAASEYPDFPEVNTSPINLPIGVLKTGLSSVIYASSTDETKQILTGVHLKQVDSDLVFAATDGHRLAVATVKLEEGVIDAGSSLAVTIPSRALSEVDRLIAKRDETELIQVHLDDSQAKLAISDITLFCRILEGAYPAFQQLIPVQFSRTVTVDSGRLKSALDRVGCLADEKNNLIKFSINPETNILTVASDAQDIGQAKENVPIDATGEAINIAFNLKYLSAAIKNVRSPEIQLNINEANQPITLTPLSEQQATHLIMPVQVRN